MESKRERKTNYVVGQKKLDPNKPPKAPKVPKNIVMLVPVLCPRSVCQHSSVAKITSSSLLLLRSSMSENLLSGSERTASWRRNGSQRKARLQNKSKPSVPRSKN